MPRQLKLRYLPSLAGAQKQLPGSERILGTDSKGKFPNQADEINMGNTPGSPHFTPPKGRLFLGAQMVMLKTTKSTSDSSGGFY